MAENAWYTDEHLKFVLENNPGAVTYSYEFVKGLVEEVLASRKTAERQDAIETALDEIRNWCRAYPLDVFPEPDFKRVREILSSNGILLDGVSASNFRHVLVGVQEIINKVVPEKAGE